MSYPHDSALRIFRSHANSYGCMAPTELDHYTCGPLGEKICAAGWSGRDCLTPICASGCLNGGECVEPSRCVCRPGWSGAHCQLCETRPGCVNGFCNAPSQCICHRGWTGWRCDEPMHTCDNNPCLNGAKCVTSQSAHSSYICVCAPGFYGANCSLRQPQQRSRWATTNEPSDSNKTNRIRPESTTVRSRISTKESPQVTVTVPDAYLRRTVVLNRFEPAKTANGSDTAKIELLVAACALLLFCILAFLTSGEFIKYRRRRQNQTARQTAIFDDSQSLKINLLPHQCPINTPAPPIYADVIQESSQPLRILQDVKLQISPPSYVTCGEMDTIDSGQCSTLQNNQRSHR